MTVEQSDIMALMEIGFTKTQAKLYLTLLKLGVTDTQSLSKKAGVPSQVTYRTLGELQQKGLVEKIIGIPQKYRAAPFCDGLSVMVNAKAKDYENAIEKSKELLQRFYLNEQKSSSISDYFLNIFEGKALMANRYNRASRNAQYTIGVCTTFQRWAILVLLVLEQIEEDLARGIKYRVILDKPKEWRFPRESWPILLNPNYKVRVAKDKLKTNILLFDDKEAAFVYYPSKAVNESPMVYTNHPSLIIAFQDHFEQIWRTSEEIDVKKYINKSNLLVTKK